MAVDAAPGVRTMARHERPLKAISWLGRLRHQDHSPNSSSRASCSASASLKSISRGRFPGNFTLGVEAPHGVTGFFEFSKNPGNQLDSGEARDVFFDPLIFAIHPKSKNLGHAESHSCVPTRKSLPAAQRN
jgi:hypothetical protein